MTKMSNPNMKISYKFAIPKKWFTQDTFKIARNLLGKLLITNIAGKLTAGMIVEVEPYFGQFDKASHSYPNKLTKRTQIQFKEGGYCYIFLIYGIYSQLCITTNKRGIPDVVLIRAIEPIVGIDTMILRRNTQKIQNLTNGPGKLTQALGITTKLYGYSLNSNTIWLQDYKTFKDRDIVAAKRIGIDYAKEYADKYWRFYIKDNPFVSKKTKDVVPITAVIKDL